MPNEITQESSGNFAFQDIHDSNFNIFIGKTAEYKDLLNQLETQKDLLAFLPEDQTEKRLRASQKIEELNAHIQQFKQSVLQLAAEFDRIEINTDRLRRAKEHFEKGEIAAARAVFDSEREQMRDENDRLVKEKERYENDVQPKLKHSSDEYYLRALMERTAYDNPNWLDDTCDYFERSINTFVTELNLFGYAGFLHDNFCLDQAEPLYERFLLEFAHSDLPKRAMTLNSLAILHEYKDDFAKAKKEFDEALTIYRKLAEDNPCAYLPNVAMTLGNIASYYQLVPDRERSINYAIESISILHQFIDNETIRRYLNPAQSVIQRWGLNKEEINQRLSAL